MENMIIWLVAGVAVIVAAISLLLLFKKNRDVQQLTEELAVVRQDRDEKSAAYEALQKDFEGQMDEVVQASIEKISHAEHAREEAVQAAQDNYEAAAEVHALLKEKEELINKMKQKTTG